MKKVLFVNACVRTCSRTRRLAQAVLDTLGGDVTEIELALENILPLDGPALEQRSAFVDAGNYTDPMFRYAKDFASADTIVIAAPYWDLSFPAMLKCYLEAVTVLGVTFRYSPEGVPISLCRAGNLIYVTTSGGPMQEMNLGFDYVKAMATTFFGIKDITCRFAENLDIQGVDAEAVLRRAIDEITKEGRTQL